MESEINAHEASNADIFQQPELKPHFKMWRYQWIGLPLLILIPLLAMLGVFGKGTETIQINGGGIEGSIEYPDKMRYGQDEFLRVKIKNISDEAIKNISVMFDENYIKGFDDVTFTPDIEENYNLGLGNIPSGETRLVDVKLQAGKTGNQSGEIKVESEGKELFSASLKTFIFP